MRAVIFFLVLSFSLLGVPLSAQTEVCDYFGGLPNVECTQSGNRVTVLINACGTIRLDVDLGNPENPPVITVDGRGFDASDYNDLNAYGSLLEDICGATTFSAGAPVGSPIDPFILQNTSSFQSRLTGMKAVARGGEGQEGETALPASALGGITADVGSGRFDFNGQKGGNANSLINFAHAFPSGFRMGGNLFFSRLSFDGFTDDVNNWAGSMFLEKSYNWLGMEMTSGATFDYLFLDDDFSPDDGQGYGAHTLGNRRFANGHTVSTGINLQYGTVGELTSKNLSIAGQYGVPLGTNGALNLSTVHIFTDQEYAGADINFGDSDFLSTSLTYDHYIGGFVVNLGVRKTLLLDGYSDTEYVLSGRLRR